jgi:hypothetical protein
MAGRGRGCLALEPLAPALRGTGHLLVAARTGPAPSAAAMHDSVTAVITGIEVAPFDRDT